MKIGQNKKMFSFVVILKIWIISLNSSEFKHWYCVV